MQAVLATRNGLGLWRKRCSFAAQKAAAGGRGGLSRLRLLDWT